jgi:hypothetical protein
MLIDRIISFFASLRLTVVCLALGVVLIFWGTLAQVDLGLYKAQNEFFRGFFVHWGPKGASWKIPVFPAGYTLGMVLLANLVAAHYKRFSFTRKKAGIWIVHCGIILLLLGQLLTDMLARESVLHLREGEAKNYSEADRQSELAVIDHSDPQLDTVVAIPQAVLAGRREVHESQLPFTVRVKQFVPNAMVEGRAAGAPAPPAATQGAGAGATVQELPRETAMDKRDVPAAIVEIVTPQGSQGTWLVSELVRPQTIEVDHRTFELEMRPRRFYNAFSIQLLKFQHDTYLGTDVPKNFSSRVALLHPETHENREVLIYMNNPLRYAGETFYQASYDPDDHGTVLQVVRNPGWLTPYFACVLVGSGLIVQFMMHLVGFATKWRAV